MSIRDLFKVKYRIVPYGIDRWAIQRGLFFIWIYLERMVGYEAFEVISFSTIAEAKEFIDSLIVERDIFEIEKRIIKDRKKLERRIEYP